MKKFLMIGCAILLALAITGSSQAFMIDFEGGINKDPVNDITGVSFDDYLSPGNTPLYGDSSTGAYNRTSDDLGLSWGTGRYHHNGYGWLSVNGARQIKVDFTNDDGTWFTTGYASIDTFYVDAYLTDGSTVSASGLANRNNPMDFVTVNATSGLLIDYVILRSADYWVADDMSGDNNGVGITSQSTLSVATNGVPEPATMLLLGSGLIGLVGFRRKFRKA